MVLNVLIDTNFRDPSHLLSRLNAHPHTRDETSHDHSSFFNRTSDTGLVVLGNLDVGQWLPSHVKIVVFHSFFMSSTPGLCHDLYRA